MHAIVRATGLRKLSNPAESDIDCFFTAVHQQVMPTLTSDDLAIFNQLLNAFLGDANLLSQEEEESRIEFFTKANSSLVTKCQQLLSMSKFRHGLAISGDMSKGLAIVQMVVDSFGKHGSSTMIIDKTDEEFFDQFVKAMKDERPNHWIVCVHSDAEKTIDYDSLNTVTDDNKCITYKGEKINLKSS